jgi:hypothetical protein
VVRGSCNEASNQLVTESLNEEGESEREENGKEGKERITDRARMKKTKIGGKIQNMKRRNKIKERQKGRKVVTIREAKKTPSTY